MATVGAASSSNVLLKRRPGAPFHNPKTSKFSQLYSLGKTLGKGTFATTKLATCTEDKSLWAAKILSKRTMSREDTEAFKQEVHILEKLDHPNVCWTREIFEDRNTYYVICELMTGGELFDRIVEKEQYTEKEAAACLVDICKALVYCHDNEIVHRDLKPENIMYASMSAKSPVKVVDFGLSTTAEQGKTMQTACGTPEYVAPEVISKKPYTNKCDMWSVGVIAYILLCGYPPFADENVRALYRAIRTCDFEFPEEDWSCISENAIDFVKSLICIDVKKRLSAKQALQHKWIVSMVGRSAAEAANASAKVSRRKWNEMQLTGAPLPELGRAKGNLKAFNARRKLRAAAMVARLRSMMDGAEEEKTVHVPEKKQTKDEKGCMIQ